MGAAILSIELNGIPRNERELAPLAQAIVASRAEPIPKSDATTHKKRLNDLRRPKWGVEDLFIGG